MRIVIARNNGNNGYHPGNHEAQVLDENGMLEWYSGGWPSKSLARAEAKRYLKLRHPQEVDPGYWSYRDHEDGYVAFRTKKACLRSAMNSQWHSWEERKIVSPSGKFEVYF